MKQIHDLRSAIVFYKGSGYGIEECSNIISVKYAMAEHYIKHGAGSPTINSHMGSPVLYTNLYESSMPLLIGLFANREANNMMLLGKRDATSRDYIDAVSKSIDPLMVKEPVCQENVIKEVDLLQQLPIPTFAPIDAGPYITLGLVYATDIETGENNCSIHRLCVQNKDTMSIWIMPSRHLAKMYTKCASRGLSFPVSINIGLDPAIYFASCFSEPFTGYGKDELSIAGGIRNIPIGISDCLSIDAKCISESEIVLEAEITTSLVDEDCNSQSGYSFAEFLGYHGVAKKSIPQVKVKQITHRNNPIYQSVLGPGLEQSELFGIPAETIMYHNLIKNIHVDLLRVHYSNVGGGLLFLILQLKKHQVEDDERVRQAGLFAISSEAMVKHVMLVDEDVNIYSHEELLWALTTRFQANKDFVCIENLPGFPADPSQMPEYSQHIHHPGNTAKMILDCTVPYYLKAKFKRSFYKY